MHPSTLLPWPGPIYNLFKPLMLPYTSNISNAIWNWYFFLQGKINLNPSQMQKSYHLRGVYALFPCSPMWRHLPSSACTHSHQLAPAARENLSTLGTEREAILQPTALDHCVNNHIPICPLYPSAVFCLTLRLEDLCRMLGECIVFADYAFVVMKKIKSHLAVGEGRAISP